MADTNGNASAPDESWFVPNFSEGFKGTRMQQGFDAEFKSYFIGIPLIFGDKNRLINY